MKLVPEFTGWWPDIGKKLPMEISVRKGLDRYGCKTSENTLREFSLVIATVAKVSRKRGLWLVVRVNKRIGVFYHDIFLLYVVNTTFFRPSVNFRGQKSEL